MQGWKLTMSDKTEEPEENTENVRLPPVKEFQPKRDLRIKPNCYKGMEIQPYRHLNGN